MPAATLPSLRTALFWLAVLGAIALNVISQMISGIGGALYSDMPWHVLDFLVGATYAGAAAAARRLGAGGRVTGMMLFGSVTWTFGTIVSGIQPFSPWWIPLTAFSNGLMIAIVGLVLTFPDGRLRSRFDAILIVGSVTLYALQGYLRLFFWDPAVSFHCLCTPNPLALISDRDLSFWIEEITNQLDVYVALGLSVTIVLRWMFGTVQWRSVNLLMSLAAVLACCTWLFADSSYWFHFGLPTGGVNYVSNLATLAIAVIYIGALYLLRQSRSRVADVMLAARDGIDRPSWDRLTRQALDDPTAHVLWRERGSTELVTAAGSPAPTRFAASGDVGRRRDRRHRP